MRSKMLAVVVAASLGVSSFSVLAAPAGDSAKVTLSASELAPLKAEIAALQQKVDDLQAQTSSQAQAAQEVQQNQQVATSTPSGDLEKRVDALDKRVNAIKVSGKMFVDFTNINQHNSDSGRTDASGTGLDVKRLYLSVDHKFNDVWSGDLTTDFNYVTSDGETNLFVKKAYVQGKVSDAAVFRAGSADMPWIAFVENYYGYRYVENTLIDRLKFGNSADWGLHLGGDVGPSNSVDYAVSVINGGGYKNPTRSDGVDVEGRVGFAPIQGMIIAVGGYSGTRGLETASIDTANTASREDLLVAYAAGRFRLGGEYFHAENWNNVVSPNTDAADGYSLWGSVALNERVGLFARYDHANLSTDLDPSANDRYYNVGAEFQVFKNLKLAAVYKHETRDGTVTTPAPTHVADTTTNELGVWGEVKF